MTNRRAFGWAAIGAFLWIAVVGGAALIGRAAHAADPSTPTKAAPFFGRYEVLLSAGVWRPIVLGLVLIVVWPVLCRRLRFRYLLPLSSVVATMWAVAVATITGLAVLASPIANQHDYLPVVARITSPGSFLDTFIARYESFPIHVKGHPPLAVLAFWILEQIGLGGKWPATMLVLAVASLAAPATIVLVRNLTGDQQARQLAVFAGLSPAVITIATSVDGAIMGVVALTAAAASMAWRATGNWALALGFLTGLLAGAALYLSYGAPLLLTPCLAVGILLIRDRKFATIAAMVAGVLVVAGLFTASGFWLLDGLDLTRAAYKLGISTRRPYWLFIWLNLAALVGLAGPAPLAGVAKTLSNYRTAKPNALWLVIAMTLLGVLAADLSGLSKGEVERIWLAFIPFLLLATIPLARSQNLARFALGLQLTAAVFLQVVWRSPW